MLASLNTDDPAEGVDIIHEYCRRTAGGPEPRTDPPAQINGWEMAFPHAGREAGAS